MLENRSFDQMLGFSGIKGMDAESGKPTVIDGLTGQETNPSPSGGTVGVSHPAKFVLPADPGHEFTNVQQQLCGMNGKFSTSTPTPGNLDPKVNGSGYVLDFAAKYPAEDFGNVMRCFEPEQLPVLTQLAQEFVVCDRWFSSMPGPTWPNRFFLHAATAGGLDHSPSIPKEITSTAGAAYKFDNGTVFDLLDSAKLEWTIYRGDDFPQALHMNGMADKFGKFLPFDRFSADLQQADYSKSYVFIEPDWHPFTHFQCGNSQHPVDDVTRGEHLLKEVYEAIRNSPVWEKSLLIITYDEHGGFYDHVPPPTTVDPGDHIDPDNNQFGFNFKQLGVRVPTVIVSPYVQRGVIDHRLYEHSSVLATIENQFKLHNLTQRDKQANPLNSLLTLTEPRSDDAPLTLHAPAESGVKCSPLFEAKFEVKSICDSVLEKLGFRTPKPVDPSLAGFTHVALQRRLTMSPASRRRHILLRASKVNSEADALRYMHHVRMQARIRSLLGI
jgi:phospholipase C